MDALCLARIESNWGGGKGVYTYLQQARKKKKKKKRKKNIPPEQGKSHLPAAYALFVFFFSFLLLSFLLLSFVCERNKKVIN